MALPDTDESAMNTLRLGGLPAKPLAVICSLALIAFSLGFICTLVDSDGNFFAFLMLSLIVLLLAGGAVSVAIRAIPRDDLDIEIILFLVPSAALGAAIFFLVLGSYIAGIFAPYAVASWTGTKTVKCTGLE